MSCPDTKTQLRVHTAKRLENLVVIEEGLALPHADDVAHAYAEVIGNEPDLIVHLTA